MEIFSVTLETDLVDTELDDVLDASVPVFELLTSDCSPSDEQPLEKDCGSTENDPFEDEPFDEHPLEDPADEGPVLRRDDDLNGLACFSIIPSAKKFQDTIIDFKSTAII